LKSILTFYEVGKEVVTKEDFEFASFTGISTYAEVAGLKDHLDWKKPDYQTFQDKVREEINALA